MSNESKLQATIDDLNPDEVVILDLFVHLNRLSDVMQSAISAAMMDALKNKGGAKFPDVLMSLIGSKSDMFDELVNTTNVDLPIGVVKDVTILLDRTIDMLGRLNKFDMPKIRNVASDVVTFLEQNQSTECDCKVCTARRELEARLGDKVTPINLDPENPDSMDDLPPPVRDKVMQIMKDVKAGKIDALGKSGALFTFDPLTNQVVDITNEIDSRVQVPEGKFFAPGSTTKH